MSDQAAGTVADAGQAVQRRINQAGNATDQLTRLIREQPVSSVLVAVGVGYLLGKIF